MSLHQLALLLAGVVSVAAASSTYNGGASDAASVGSGAAGARLRSVAAQQIEERVQSSLRAEIEGGGEVTERLLETIERALWTTFQAMPKNEAGRIGQRPMRYLAHNYFAKEHGWLLKGLEPSRLNPSSTEMHQVSVLQAKAPALVAALFQARTHDRGFSFSDVVAMVATIEQLILDESNTLLEAAYLLNAHTVAARSTEPQMHEILRTFLLLFRSNNPYNTSDVEGHQNTKRLYAQRGGELWKANVRFEESALSTYKYAHRNEVNTFSEDPFTFGMASEIVVSMTQAYGKWQHEDCIEMKSHLMALDPSGRSGRVPLSVFHSQPRTGKYSFTETEDYLRRHGSLDDTSRGEPKVLIANYLANPSNCIAESAYFSVCCLSECEVLLNALEAEVQAPYASADRLVNLVANLSSSSVEAPRELPRSLVSKMQTIATANGGSIPLHGRLFAQWMHYAFPAECPYPRASADAAALTASQWLGEDIEGADEANASSDPSLSQWSNEEILPLHDPTDIASSWRGFFRMVMRCFFGLAALVVACRLAGAAWQAGVAGTTFSHVAGKASLKEQAWGTSRMLPMHAKQV